MSQHKDNLDQLREVRDEFAKALEHFPDMRVGKRLAALDEILAGKSIAEAAAKARLSPKYLAIWFRKIRKAITRGRRSPCAG